MTPLKILAIASVLAMTPGPATAATVDLGKHSPSEIKSTCGAVGGDYIRGGGVWSCFKKCQGGTCSVSCDKDGCTGTTPDPRAKPVLGRRAVVDTLRGVVAR